MTTAPFGQTRRGFVGIAIGALALGIAAAPAAAQKRGGTLTATLPYDSDTLNVYSTGFLSDVQSTIVEGLITPDHEGRYVPVLATAVPSVENGLIKVIDGGKKMVVTFKLRPGVVWSDGQPFTSADVRFTWESVKNPKFIAEGKQGVDDIDSIDTPDPLTAVVNFNTVSPFFPSGIFSLGMLPKHALEGKDLNTDPYNEKPLGTGPFMIADYKRGQYVVVERNPRYWRKDEKGEQLPYIDRIIFKNTPAGAAMVTAIRSGEVQLAYNVPYPQADQLAALPGYELISNPIFSWQRLDFNFKGPEAFRDVNVRRAVAHAINKQTISKALGGYPIVRKTPVVPQLYFYDPEVPEYAFDPERAKKMLDDAGWKVGSDGIRAKGAEKMSYRFIVQAGLAADETAQQVIIANLKAIGIEAKPDNKSGVAFREARYKGLYDILYSRWITSPDPIYSKFYGTTGLNNGTGYSNAALDSLLDKVEHTLDIGEQKRLYKEMQRIIYDDVVTVATVTNVSLIAKTKKLGNFKANPTNRTIFNDTSSWYLTE